MALDDEEKKQLRDYMRMAAVNRTCLQQQVLALLTAAENLLSPYRRTLVGQDPDFQELYKAVEAASTKAWNIGSTDELTRTFTDTEPEHYDYMRGWEPDALRAKEQGLPNYFDDEVEEMDVEGLPWENPLDVLKRLK